MTAFEGIRIYYGYKRISVLLKHKIIIKNFLYRLLKVLYLRQPYLQLPV